MLDIIHLRLDMLFYVLFILDVVIWDAGGYAQSLIQLEFPEDDQ